MRKRREEKKRKERRHTSFIYGDNPVCSHSWCHCDVKMEIYKWYYRWLHFNVGTLDISLSVFVCLQALEELGKWIIICSTRVGSCLVSRVSYRLLSCSAGGCLTWCPARVYDLLLHISRSCETCKLLWTVAAVKSFTGSIQKWQIGEGSEVRRSSGGLAQHARMCLRPMFK